MGFRCYRRTGRQYAILKGPKNMKNIVVEGHRGYCAKYPENTMLGFRKALELDIDAIETDVHMTADYNIVKGR